MEARDLGDIGIDPIRGTIHDVMLGEPDEAGEDLWLRNFRTIVLRNCSGEDRWDLQDELLPELLLLLL